MPRVAKSVPLTTLKSAAAELKRHVARADLNRDGKLSVAEAARYGRAINDRAIGDALATMTGFALHTGDGAAPGRAVSLSAVKSSVDAAVRVISAKERIGISKRETRTGPRQYLNDFSGLARRAEPLLVVRRAR
jgi:hypothetical protein